MNLVQIARKIWKHKLVTAPVIALTFLGALYVVAIKDPVYEASSSYLLINPPPPPTEEEIARDPALSGVDADNPFTRFADQSVVVQALASTLSGESARAALEEAGADRRYTVAPSSEFGYSSPIVQITANGVSQESAVRTAEVVGNAVTDELERMQQAEGVASDYRITTQQVHAPDDAELRAAGNLRALVGVLAIGTILLFVAVSVADAVTTWRRERAAAAIVERMRSSVSGDRDGRPERPPSVEAVAQLKAKRMRPTEAATELADELDVDLDEIEGSGKDGRITVNDVRAADRSVAGGKAETPAPATEVEPQLASEAAAASVIEVVPGRSRVSEERTSSYG